LASLRTAVAAGRAGEQRPAEGERIAVDVGRAAAVEGDAWRRAGIAWLAPALATGGEFSVLTATVSGRLESVASLTVRAIR
jgi:hypothetical protein